MKFFHISDLHIGKSLNGHSLLEDQRYVLSQILEEIDKNDPEAILIAGDIYDKPMPGTAAVSLWDDFLTALSERQLFVFVISGNHDSPERIDYGSRIMKSKKIHIAGVYQGEIRQVTLQDIHGPIHFHLLPFVRPANVRAYYPEAKIENYTDAASLILSGHPLKEKERNILTAHQFVLPPQGSVERSESEIEPVGGLNSIPATLFDHYDYVALGHLHGPQQLGRQGVRYAGSPLKYSFSECLQKKSITMVEVGEKGECNTSVIPLKPRRDMRKIRGPFAELTAPQVLKQGNQEDYIHITLTDEEEIMDAVGKLRRFYPNLLELNFDNSRSRAAGQNLEAAAVQAKDAPILFGEFYWEQNGKALTAVQEEIVSNYLRSPEDNG